MGIARASLPTCINTLSSRSRARSEKLGGKMVEAVDWLATFVTRYSATWNFMHGTYIRGALSLSFYLEYLTTLPAFFDL